MPKNTPSTENKRLKIILLTIYFCFILVLGRLFYWQIIKGHELRDKAISQIYKLNTIIPPQGDVLSSDNYPLSLDYSYYSLSLYKPNFKYELPKILQEIEKVEPEFATQNAVLLEKFNNPAQKWMEFVTKFTREQSQQLAIISGLEFYPKQARLYPEKSLALNIIRNLEQYYRRQISGQVGFSRSVIDGIGNSLLTRKNWKKNEFDGQDIHTTINRQIQLLSEKSLINGIEKYQADSASLIIIKPQTGEIIAMASVEATPSSTSTTKVTNISNLFEPGSIFKPIIMSAALDSGNLSPNFICDKCQNSRQIGQYSINNWDDNFHPDSTLQDIIKNSDNIGMSYVIDQLGLKKFLEYYQLLRLDQKTGVELSGESVSPQKTSWPDIDFATASFGQGIAVNQLQMIQAFNTIANNGELVKVHLNQQSPVNKVKVFDQSTTALMTKILNYAVDNSPVSVLKPKDISICAKSGTSQVAVKGGYTDSSTIGSYIGYYPCENPIFTMIVTIDNPKSSPWGSSTAAPIWFELAEKIEPLL